MDFLSLIKAVKDKIPQPIEYLKDVIDGTTPSRVSAFLAVLSGVALVIGFMFITVAITKYSKKLTAELVCVSGALVTLATFSKVDRNSISTSQTTTNTDTNITKQDTKEVSNG